MVKKPGRHDLNQVIKVSVTSAKSHKHPVLPDTMHRVGRNITSMAFLSKMQTTNQTARSFVKSDKMGDILQQAIEEKERIRNYHRLEETKGT